MINKLKTLAIAAIVTGATVASTQATTKTNEQVLQNISIQLKVYSQGTLKGTGENAPTLLPANVTTLTTSDVIRQLAIVTSNAFTFDKNEKLVRSIVYSNFVAPTGLATSNVNTFPLFSTTNWSVDYVGLDGTNLFTNSLSFNSDGSPASYFITNNSDDGAVELWQVVGTNAPTDFATLGSGAILTNFYNGTNFVYSVVTNANTNLVAGGFTPFSYWTTIVSNGANLVITEFTPTTTPLFTNASYASIGVLTSKNSTPASALIPVDDWIALDDKGQDIFNITGKHVSGNSEDNGPANATGETIYTTKELEINIQYPTNGAPAGQTNLLLFPRGFDKEVGQIINLTVNGNIHNAQKFAVIGSESMSVSTGEARIGGTFTTNSTVTNTFNGITTTNDTSYLNTVWGTNHHSFSGRVQLPTQVTVVGTVTITPLPSELTPLEP